MNLIIIAAFIAVCGADKLDRTYLPPNSAKTAGGSPNDLRTPFAGNSLNQRNGLPKGSYTNDAQGVVVDAAFPGTRASGNEATGLGSPRPVYGSSASRVGDAAFRGASKAGFRQSPSGSNGFGVQGASNGFQPNDVADVESQEPLDSVDAGLPETLEPSLDLQSRFQEPSQNGQAVFRQSPNGIQSGFEQPAFGQASRAQFPVESRPERPQAAQDRAANTLRFDSDIGTDTFSYSFETDNGISAEESGVATNGVQAQGAFSYTGDDGQVYSITYTADENGYQPKGAHLPTPPPIPVEILRALEQNARDEAAGLIDDGSYNAQKYNAGSYYTESNNDGQYDDKQSVIQPGLDTTATGGFIQNRQPFRSQTQDNQDTIDSNQNAQPEEEQPTPFRQQSFSNGNGNSRGQNRQPIRNQAQSGMNFGFNQNGQSEQEAQSGPVRQQSFNNGNGRGQNRQPSRNQINGLNNFEANQNSEPQEEPQPGLVRQQLVSNGNGRGQNRQPSRFVDNRFGLNNEYLPPLNVQIKNQNIDEQNIDDEKPELVQTNGEPSAFNPPQRQRNGFQRPIRPNQPSSPSTNYNQGRRPSIYQARPTPSDTEVSTPSVTLATPISRRPSLSANQFPALNNRINPVETATEDTENENEIQNPTAQPLTELSTPLESDTNEFNSQPQRPSYEKSSAPVDPSQFNAPVNVRRPFTNGNRFNSPKPTENKQSQFAVNRFAENTNVPEIPQSNGNTNFNSFPAQPQGEDDSYYYNQPSRPFNTPTAQQPDQQFLNPTFNQFDGVTEQQELTTTFAPQRFPSRSSSTEVDETDNKFPSQTNGITQASFGPFPPAPTQQPLFPSRSSVSRFNKRPTKYQQTTPAPFEPQQPDQSQPDSNETNQNTYDGEIYEYNKPAVTLPPPAKTGIAASQSESEESGEIDDQTASRFGSQPEVATEEPRQTFVANGFGQRTQNVPQQPARSSRPFTAQRPQFGSAPVTTELETTELDNNGNAQVDQSVTQGSRSQFSQPRPFSAPKQTPQTLPTLQHKCCSPNGNGRRPSQRVQSPNAFPSRNGPVSSQDVGGKGEVFSASRTPPRFDEKTGYHY